MIKGWRTVVIGLLLAVAPVALQYLGGVHWENYVPASLVPVISGAIMIGMRAFTTTPIGTK